MFITIFAPILLIVGIAVLLIGPKIGYTDGHEDVYNERGSYVGRQPVKKAFSLRLFGLIPIVLALIFTFFASTFSVHAKEIGVVTSFGKPVREAGAGFHKKAPWQKVTNINETVFTDTYSGKDSLPVRLGDGNTAKIAATIRWHVDPKAADYIYSNYRSDDPSESLRDAVVDTQFAAAVNDVLGSFNPTALIQSAGTQTTTVSFTPDYDKLAQEITDSMKGRVIDAEGVPMVTLDGITVSGIEYSQSTESRINALMAQVAKTQEAKQAAATAAQQALANDKLAASVSHDPNVLVSKCLDDLADGKFTAPAGFSCWPGSGSAVVVPSGN